MIPDPALAEELVRQHALRSPVGLAELVLAPRWRPAKHLDILDVAVRAAVAEKNGRLIISLPVRSGKSTGISRILPLWFLGLNPDAEVILAAHDAESTAIHGAEVRNLMREWGPDLFGVDVNPADSARDRWRIEGHRGGMQTFGMGGSVIGRGADLLIIDDPHPHFESAMSDLDRQRRIDWVNGTLISRLNPGGTIILICSRWHEDDLSGHLLRTQPDRWTEIRIPAICEDPEGDLLGRDVGESYWPDRWSANELELLHSEVGQVVWQAQYQQDPINPEGGLFPVDRFRIIDAKPPIDSVEWCRGWDLAASEGRGDYTAGVLIGRYRDDGRWVIAEVIRGQWDVSGVRRRILGTATLDGRTVMIQVPREPGQAGVAQAQQLTTMLAGYNVEVDPQTGSKLLRAQGLAAQVQVGNVDLVAGDWTQAFIDEARAFPRGRHDDQIDAAASAFNRVSATPQLPPSGFGLNAFEGLYRNDGVTSYPQGGPFPLTDSGAPFFGAQRHDIGSGVTWTPSPYS